MDRLYAVLGRLHLRTGRSSSTRPTRSAAESPRVLVPAHRTSRQAQHLLAARLPDAFLANAVGSRFEL